MNREIAIADRYSESFDTPETALHAYEQLVGPTRERFAVSSGLHGMVSTDTDARTMAAFLLHFSALSVPITEPVEGWIRRAGERCEVLGFTAIGSALRRHSKAEAGHHKYHNDDFTQLVRFRNQRWTPQVDPESIRGHGITPGGERY